MGYNPVMYHFINYMAPFGPMTLGADDSHVLVVTFEECKICTGANEVLYQLASQLDLYFEGKLKDFTVPAKIHYQSDFSRDVLEALKEVRYGTTMTYADLARKSGHPGAFRAVGSVLHKNILCLIYPCHRIVAKDSVGGFGGGLELKKWLLEHEKSFF